jgi:hypothetical protein
VGVHAQLKIIGISFGLRENFGSVYRGSVFRYSCGSHGLAKDIAPIRGRSGRHGAHCTDDTAPALHRRDRVVRAQQRRARRDGASRRVHGRLIARGRDYGARARLRRARARDRGARAGANACTITGRPRWQARTSSMMPTSVIRPMYAALYGAQAARAHARTERRWRCGAGAAPNPTHRPAMGTVALGLNYRE